METKICSKCKQLLPKADFYISKDKKDKLQPYCKYCKKIDQIERRLKNKDDKPKKEDFIKKGSKVCSKCKEEKNYDEFYLCYRRKDKTYRYQTICKECETKRNREKYENRKIEIIQKINKDRSI